MGKLPACSGKEAIAAFEKLGYRVARQRGSHLRLDAPPGSGKKPLTVPNHAAIGIRTLA